MLFQTPLRRTSYRYLERQKQTPKASTRIATLKDDCSLFSRLYIACQSRQGNVEVFFKHENRTCPPSLSSNGDQLRTGEKSDLLQCTEVGTSDTSPQIEVVVVDAAAASDMLPPVNSKSFLEYAYSIFIPYHQSCTVCKSGRSCLGQVHRQQFQM